VKINCAGTVEEMFAKVKSAPNEYNFVSIDPGRIPMYKNANLLQPVDTKKLGAGATLHIPIV